MKQPITAASLNFWGSFLEGQNHGQHYKTQPHTLLQTLFMPGRTAMLGVGPSWIVNCDDKGWTEHISTTSHLFDGAQDGPGVLQ